MHVNILSGRGPTPVKQQEGDWMPLGSLKTLILSMYKYHLEFLDEVNDMKRNRKLLTYGNHPPIFRVFVLD